MLIIYGIITMPLSSLHGLSPPPLGVVRWNSAENRFQRFDSEVSCVLCVTCCFSACCNLYRKLVSEATSHENKSSWSQGCHGDSYFSQTILAAIKARSGTNLKTGIFFWPAYLDMRMGSPPTYISFAALILLHLWIWQDLSVPSYRC